MEREVIQAIESILAKGDRAEVIPVKNGVRVMVNKRKTIINTGEKKDGKA